MHQITVRSDTGVHFNKHFALYQRVVAASPHSSDLRHLYEGRPASVRLLPHLRRAAQAQPLHGVQSHSQSGGEALQGFAAD